ncbi:unnamed protein product, partial [marine sediment metagenome]
CNVRDTIKYDDETKEGVLDLPIEAEVKIGVQYDNETKTGTYTGALTPADIEEIVDKIWDEPQADHVAAGSMGASFDFNYHIESGRWKIESNQMIFYKADNVTEVARFDLIDDGTNVIERTRV